MSAHAPSQDNRLDPLLAALLTDLAQQADDPLRRARLAWPAVCGAALARHTVVLGLTDEGMLRVGANGPHWREACFEHRGGLLSRVRRAAPTIRGLRLETLPEAPALPRPPPVAPPPPHPATADIEHVALRGALDGLLAARRGSRP